MDNSKPEYLLLRDVTRSLRISHSTLKRMIADGEIVAVEIAGNWRIPKADFEAYLEKKRNVPAIVSPEKVAA